MSLSVKDSKSVENGAIFTGAEIKKPVKTSSSAFLPALYFVLQIIISNLFSSSLILGKTEISLCGAVLQILFIYNLI